MNYSSIFTLHNLALLSDWLDETGELYVDIDLPHSGGSGISYFIRSLQDLKELMAQQVWPEIVASVFHHHQYPLRGVVNEGLIKEALHEIGDGEWYAIISLKGFYPASCSFLGGNKSHAELRKELESLVGQQVGIGQSPFDIHDGKWFYFHPDEVLQVAVKRNQNYYEQFAHNPNKYEWIAELWQK